jgi:hypothetical protein
MDRTSLLRALLGLIPALLITGNATASSAPTEVFERDDAEACDPWMPEPVPVAYAMPLETTPRLDLRVHVILDGITVERGQQIMGRVAEAYDTIGIDLKATYQEVTIEPDDVDSGAAGTGEPAHGSAFMPAVKAAVGGARPWGTDVVYALTSDLIVGTTAGYADCIGGVRSTTESFAVGEASVNGGEDTGMGRNNVTAKIATHEIAHLLGAHHHFANCAEAPKDPDGYLLLEACTVMVNDIGLASFGWSTIEAAVVRGYVSDFAIAAHQGPEPVHPRGLSLKITKKSVAKGDVTSETPECVSDLPISIERRQGAGWIQIASDRAFSSGNYEIEIPKPAGTYRAVVAQNYVVGDTHREMCAGAASMPTRAF